MSGDGWMDVVAGQLGVEPVVVAQAGNGESIAARILVANEDGPNHRAVITFEHVCILR